MNIVAGMAELQRKNIADLTRAPRVAPARSLPIAGFGGGTMILTDDGSIPVDWLRPGDLVLTLNDGFQPIQWIGRDCLTRAPETVPAVHIPICSLGNGVSTTPPLLAARHRVVLTGWQIELNFGVDTILAEAHDIEPDLVTFPQVNGGTTACTHILMQHHQIIQADGCWVETMQMTHGTLASLSIMAIEDIARLDLDPEKHHQSALACMKPFEAHQLGLNLSELVARGPY